MRQLSAPIRKLGPIPPALRLLHEAAPTWVNAQVDGLALHIEAQLLRGGGIPSRPYFVEATAKNFTVEGREVQGKKALLPTFCPERHINPDQSFCLGLKNAVTDQASAELWWQKLKVFLLGQETAHETGCWPPGAQLSHGVAAEIELLAEKEAEQLGTLQEYRQASQFDTGPIYDLLRKINKEGYLVNGRSICPCGRRTGGRHDRPKLRRECKKERQPCLPLLEKFRRKKVEDYWEEQRKHGRECCGTMKKCPLRKA